MAGEWDKTKGAVKDAVGGLTGDTKTQAEGKMDKAKGEVKALRRRYRTRREMRKKICQDKQCALPAAFRRLFFFEGTRQMKSTAVLHHN